MTAPATDLVPPPPRWWWGFRVLGLRVPEEHRAWVAHHLRSDTAVRRTALLRQVPSLPFWAALAAILLATVGGNLGGFGGLVGAITGSLTGAWRNVERNRRRMLRWQRVDAQGEPVEPRGVARLGNVAATLLMVALSVALLVLFRWVLLALS